MLQIFAVFFNLLFICRYIYYLILQVILLLGYGPDTPPRKLFWQRKNPKVGSSTSSDRSCLEDEVKNELRVLNLFSWRPVVLFLFWTLLWSSYVLVLCGMYVQQHGGLPEMFKRFFFCRQNVLFKYYYYYAFLMTILQVPKHIWLSEEHGF